MINFLKKFYPTKYSFGATSAVITSLALMTGLDSLANAKTTIIGGLLVIALADNISDALGIHVYQESDVSRKDVWLSTFTNFSTRLLVSLFFIFLIIVLPIYSAIIFSIILGILILVVISIIIAKNRKVNPVLLSIEHVGIAVIVITLSNFLGKLIIGKF